MVVVEAAADTNAKDVAILLTADPGVVVVVVGVVLRLVLVVPLVASEGIEVLGVVLLVLLEEE